MWKCFLLSHHFLDCFMAWHSTVTIAGLPVSFKLNSGAEVNTILVAVAKVVMGKLHIMQIQSHSLLLEVPV